SPASPPPDPRRLLRRGRWLRPFPGRPSSAPRSPRRPKRPGPRGARDSSPRVSTSLRTRPPLARDQTQRARLALQLEPAGERTERRDERVDLLVGVRRGHLNTEADLVLRYQRVGRHGHV